VPAPMCSRARRVHDALQNAHPTQPASPRWSVPLPSAGGTPQRRRIRRGSAPPALTRPDDRLPGGGVDRRVAGGRPRGVVRPQPARSPAFAADRSRPTVRHRAVRRPGRAFRLERERRLHRDRISRPGSRASVPVRQRVVGGPPAHESPSPRGATTGSPCRRAGPSEIDDCLRPRRIRYSESSRQAGGWPRTRARGRARVRPCVCAVLDLRQLGTRRSRPLRSRQRRRAAHRDPAASMPCPRPSHQGDHGSWACRADHQPGRSRAARRPHRGRGGATRQGPKGPLRIGSHGARRVGRQARPRRSARRPRGVAWRPGRGLPACTAGLATAAAHLAAHRSQRRPAATPDDRERLQP